MKTFVTHLFQAKKIPLWILVFLALSVRLYRVTNPILDWHAFRQADTASVTREYVKHGIDLLRPTYHDHSNIQSGFDNPEGYRMVEFPLVNGLLAQLLILAPSLSLALVSRLASIAVSLGTLVFLYKLTKEITNSSLASWLSGFFYALMPYSIYYSRAVLPEPYMLFFSMGSIYWLTQALKQKKLLTSWQWWSSAIFLSLAFLMKPFVVFLIPVYLVFIWQTRKKHFVLNPVWLIYAAIAITPILWWRNWIQQFPTGIPVTDWLFNGNGIRFRPAWFRWLFYERITKMILGYTGVFLAGAALIWTKTKTHRVLLAWSFSLLAYISVFASGNVQHDYYQIIFIPLLSIALGVGTLHLWRQANNRFAKDPILRKVAQGGVVLMVLLSLLLPWTQIGGYFNVNHWEYVKAGKAVDQLVPADAQVIAPAFGDTMFLFQTNRAGWPIGFEIEDKISRGAEYYVTTSYDDEARELETLYKVLEKNNLYMIIDLTSERGEP